MTDSKRARFVLGAILGLAFFQLIAVVLRATPPQAGLLVVAGGPLLTILATLGFRAFGRRGTQRHARAAWVVCAVLSLSCVAFHELRAATMECAVVGCLAFIALGGALAGLEANLESETGARSAWQGSAFGLVASWPCDEVAYRALDSHAAFPILVFSGLLLSGSLLRRPAADSPGPQRSAATRGFPLAALGIGVGLATLFGAATHYGREVCHSIHFDRVHCSILTAFGIGVLASVWTAGRERADRVVDRATRFAIVWVLVAGTLMFLAPNFGFASRAVVSDWRSSWLNDIARGFFVFGVPSGILGFVSGRRRWDANRGASDSRERGNPGVVDDWVAFVASTLSFVLPLSTLGRMDIVIPTILLCVLLQGLGRGRHSFSPSGSLG